MQRRLLKLIKSGRVVRIFDDETLVVNLGSDDGVEKGATMSIYAPPVEITDPATGDELGAYHHPKGNVKVGSVHKKFCIAGPFPIRRPVSKPAAPANLFQQFQTEYRTERGHLNIDEGDVDPFPSGSAIRVGDPVYVTVPDPSGDEGSSTGQSESGAEAAAQESDEGSEAEAAS